MPPTHLLHWHFDPIALRVGWLSIHWYGLCWGLAFVQSALFAKRLLARAGFPGVDVEGLTTAAFLGTIIGARLAHCFFYDPALYLSHPLRIFALWEGGMASHGGAVGLLLTLAWALPRSAPGLPLLTLLDAIAMPAAIGGALVRIANFLNSEILGRPTDGSWGVIFDKVDALPRIPIQLFEAISYLAVAAWLAFVVLRLDGLKRRGNVAGHFFVLVFSARIVLEAWKTPQAAYEDGFTISVGQWLSVPFIAIGLWLVLRARKVAASTTPQSDAMKA
jgi:prolipoprotein diacylglyceryl transferase